MHIYIYIHTSFDPFSLSVLPPLTAIISWNVHREICREKAKKREKERKKNPDNNSLVHDIPFTRLSSNSFVEYSARNSSAENLIQSSSIEKRRCSQPEKKNFINRKLEQLIDAGKQGVVHALLLNGGRV